MKKTLHRNALLAGILIFAIQLGSCGMKETMAEAMSLQNAIIAEFEIRVPSINYSINLGSSLSIGISDERVVQVTPDDLKTLANEIHEFVLNDSSKLAEADIIKIWFVEHDWVPEDDSKYIFSFKKE